MKLDEILRNITILYVEDNINIREEISCILSCFTKNFKIASNGEEALEIYKNSSIDLIISDLCMPLMNGMELISEIRKTDKTIPIIVVTSYNKNEYLLKCANLNIQAYILKPINYKGLKNAIYKAVEYLKVVKNIYVNISETISYDKVNSTFIFNDGTKTVLNKKEKIFMDLLVKHRNNLVSYNQIEESVWGDFDETMTSSALRTVVKNLRKKIRGDFIYNISGLGYKLITESSK